ARALVCRTIPGPLNRRMRPPPLRAPRRYKMQQRINAAGDDIRMLGEIPGGPEHRMRITPLCGAEKHVVPERRQALQIETRLADIEIRLQQRRNHALALP